MSGWGHHTPSGFMLVARIPTIAATNGAARAYKLHGAEEEIGTEVGMTFPALGQKEQGVVTIVVAAGSDGLRFGRRNAGDEKQQVK